MQVAQSEAILPPFFMRNLLLAFTVGNYYTLVSPYGVGGKIFTWELSGCAHEN
jgi:hypothetical protein